MDSSEQLAAQYLKSLAIGEVVYEPDGNIPPDFRVGSTIAVEVRRLNQNYEDDSGRTRGLEELDIPLRQRLKRYLHDFAPTRDGESWYVGYGFRRPLDSWATLEPKLASTLREFMDSPSRRRTRAQITPSFEIDFLRSGTRYETFYRLGASMDEDSGGWVMLELERNLRLCIAEKERKIAPYRKRYPVWWLVLLDHIDFGLDPEDLPRFKSDIAPKLLHTFDKLVLLDPRNPMRAVEA